MRSMFRLDSILSSVRSFRNHPGLLHVIARGAVVVLGLQVGGIVLGYVAQAVLARRLGVYQYGIYRYANSWITLLGTLSCLGFPTALQRFVPEHVTRGERDLLRGLLRGSRALVVTSGMGIGAGAAVLFSWSAGRWLEPAQAIALARTSWLVPVLAVFVLNTQVARAFHRMAVAFVPFHLGRPGAALIAGLSVGWILFPAGSSVLAGIGVILLAITVLQWMWVDGIARPLVGSVRPRSAWRKWFAVALPLLLMTGFGILLNQLGVLMVGSLLGPSDAGIFAAAVQISMPVGFFLASINNVVAPRISELYHWGRREELQRMLSSVVHWIFWPSLVAGCGLVVLARPILSLFGPEFSGATPVTVLVVLVAGRLVTAAAGSVGLIMNVTGHQNLNAVVYGSAAVINVVLNIIFLPRYGVIGGAIAMASTMFLWNVVLVWMVARRLGLYPSILAAFRVQ